MASGQIPGPQPQGPYPGYMPVYQPVQKPTIEYMRPMVSDAMLTIISVLGLFLMMLGWVIWGASNDNTVEDLGQYLKAFGMFILTAAMMVGGLLRVDMDKWVRAVLIFGAVLLISWVGFWFTF